MLHDTTHAVDLRVFMHSRTVFFVAADTAGFMLAHAGVRVEPADDMNIAYSTFFFAGGGGGGGAQQHDSPPILASSSQTQWPRRCCAEIPVWNLIAPQDAEGDIDLAALEEMLRADGKPPALVAITHIPTSSGRVYDAVSVGGLTKAAGVPYLLDACQSVGQVCPCAGSLQSTICVAYVTRIFSHIVRELSLNTG